MKRLKYIIILLFTTLNTHAQAILFNISQQDALVLKKSLNKKADDTTRINILLRLAEYNLFKDGDLKINLDSAAAFIMNASALSSKLSSEKYNGYVLMEQAILTRKRGNTIEGKQLIGNVIGLLQNGGDEFHLAMAFLEQLRYYDFKTLPSTTDFFNSQSRMLLQLQKIKIPEQRDYCINAIENFFQTNLSNASYSTRLDFLNHLVSAFNIMKDKQNEFWARKEMADIHYQQGKPTVAINELLELIKEQKAAKDPRVCFTYDLLAGVYNNTSNYEKGLLYAFEIIKNVSTAFDSTYLPDFYFRISMTYDLVHNQKEALAWNMKMYNYEVATNDTRDIYYTISYIAENLILSGKGKEALDFILQNQRKYTPVGINQEKSMWLCLARSYKMVNKIELAEKCYLKFVDLAKTKNADDNPTLDNLGYAYFAWFYLSTKQYNKAEKYFNLSSQGWSKSQIAVTTKRKSDFFFKLDSARGNYLSAIKNLEKLNQIHDSVFTVAKNKQIEDLRISYETEQKDQLINLKEKNIQLLTKQDDLQKNELRQAGTLRNITLAAILLLAIIIALLYNRYRLKQRTNKKLETQQEEIEEQNGTLRHLVTEKEWLLKEIHHRVKNNFQTVMGLLGTQSGYLKNDVAITAVTDSQRRIQAMSLIHQRLYQSNNLSAINMKDYVHELVNSLSDGFNTNNNIRFKVEIEPIELDLAHCIPLGLILNEAITNSFKYAFPVDKEGVITISFKNTSENNLLLTITDNGIGLPLGFNTMKSGSMGMNLMRGLCEEIGARFKIDSENGTLITVIFEYDPDTALEIAQIKSKTYYSL